MRLTIQTMTYGPDGLARTDEGKAVFVSGGLIGDTVEARITEDGPSFSRAVVEEVLEPSADRIQAPCPFIAICGGCPWGGLSHEAQLAAKEENLRSALTRIGKFSADEVAKLMRPIRHAKEPWGYRNKIELAPVREGGKFRLGMHGRDAGQVVKVDACPLFDKKHAKAIKAVAGVLGFLGNSRDLELERVGIRSSRRTGALEVALWTPTGAFPRAQVSRVLGDAVRATSVVRVMSKGEKRARRVAGVEALAGEGSWTEKIGEESMRLSAPSFFQVNTKAAEMLIDLVMEALDPQPDEFGIDLYCGAGTFTLPLARAGAEVVAVESAGSSVRDLRRNAERAGADIDIIGGDAARELPELGELDALVVDPPRAGLADGVVASIAAASPRRVAYVSCDASTWARDAARFEREGYRLIRVTPVDLFPQTYHVEVVSIFERSGS